MDVCLNPISDEGRLNTLGHSRIFERSVARVPRLAYDSGKSWRRLMNSHMDWVISDDLLNEQSGSYGTLSAELFPLSSAFDSNIAIVAEHGLAARTQLLSCLTTYCLAFTTLRKASPDC
jgi:hypothetical protein